MKKFTYITLVLFSLLFIAGCSSNDEPSDYVQQPELSQDEVLVKFNLDASSVVVETAPMVRTYNPDYVKSEFAIHAFRQNSDNKFVFDHTIDLTNFTFVNKKLSGEAAIKVGKYKFLMTYGESSDRLTFPDYSLMSELDESTLITCTYNNLGLATELFLLTDYQTAQSPTPAGELKVYEFKTTGNTPNVTVNEKLKRAVARVDVMFISATKSGTDYTERAFYDAANASNDILDQRAINLSFTFSQLNDKVSLIGEPSTTSRVNNVPVSLNYRNGAGYTNNSKVTIGTATASTVGTSGYTSYDDVKPADIISKGAHVFGAYFLPFATGSSDRTSIELTIEGSKSATDVATRSITIPNVPLEQNKVTLIKVHVLGDQNKTVFDTNVNFEVEVITDWSSAEVVVVEVD